MTRIEEALSKLQARGASGAAEREGAFATRHVSLQAGAHSYSGKPVRIDFDHLRRLGLMPAETEARKLAEQCRMIKRPLLRNAISTPTPSSVPNNLLLVTSALPGEGKTFACLNLCLSLAREQDWTVVLVDGDSNKPHLSRLLGAEKNPGLMDLLREPAREFDSIVMPTDVRNLSFLPARTRQSDSVELLASSAMQSLCDRAGRSDPKRMLVFDSPPLLLTSEALALAAQVSQIVVVVKANKTPRPAVLAALGRLDSGKAINLLLNQAIGSADDGEYGGQHYGYDT
jgi:receptor protein-tyrosine kinase